jgi:hypothetical protein
MPVAVWLPPPPTAVRARRQFLRPQGVGSYTQIRTSCELLLSNRVTMTHRVVSDASGPGLFSPKGSGRFNLC